MKSRSIAVFNYPAKSIIINSPNPISINAIPNGAIPASQRKGTRMYYDTPTNEWNREARRAAEIMTDFRNARTDKDEDGFMVVIGDQLKGEGSLFIGWCRRDEVGKTLELVQFGSAKMLGVLSWLPAAVSDVTEHLKALAKFRTRTCSDNWFRKLPQVEAYLDQVRNGVYGNAPEELETQPNKTKPASTLLAPPKKTKQKRRTNKRQPKRRRR